MFAIDTNLLIYAHNSASQFNEKAANFIEKVMNTHDEDGNLPICIPAQVLMEFIHVITWERLEKPLSIPEAIQIVQDYIDTGITIIHQKETQVQTFLSLLNTVKSRKKIFDIALVASLKDNETTGIYTVL